MPRDRTLEQLRNLGPASARWLARAGIHSGRQLRTLGAVNAYRRALLSGARPNLNLLWALQGAVQDRDWRQLTQAEKARLLMELDDLLGPEQPRTPRRPAAKT